MECDIFDLQAVWKVCIDASEVYSVGKVGDGVVEIAIRRSKRLIVKAGVEVVSLGKGCEVVYYFISARYLLAMNGDIALSGQHLRRLPREAPPHVIPGKLGLERQVQETLLGLSGGWVLSNAQQLQLTSSRKGSNCLPQGFISVALEQKLLPCY